MWLRDPVCGKRINRNRAHVAVQYRGETHYLCCPQCQAAFERDPERYLRARGKRRARGTPTASPRR